MRFSAFLVALLAVSLAACSSSRSMAQTDMTAQADLIYVCNQMSATVSIIDAATNEIVETIDLQELGFSSQAKPHHIVVEPDGSHWYLSMIGENRVLKFDAQNNIVASTEIEVPGMLALHPGGEYLFVGRSMSAVNAPQSIGMVNRSDMSLEELEVFFPRPHALTVSPDGEYVFSASLAENRMIAIDIASGDGEFFEFEGPIHTMVQFAATPDGETMIVGGQMTGKLFILDISELPAISVREIVDVEAQPWHPIFGADGRTAYFGNKTASVVSVVDVESGEVTALIRDEGIAQPHGTALSADGRFLYVTNQHTAMDMHAPGAHAGHMNNGKVVVIDTATNEVVKVLEVGQMPSGIGSRGVAR